MEASSRALSFSSKSTRFSVSKSATALTQRRTRTKGELDDNYYHHHRITCDLIYLFILINNINHDHRHDVVDYNSCVK